MQQIEVRSLGIFINTSVMEKYESQVHSDLSLSIHFQVSRPLRSIDFRSQPQQTGTHTHTHTQKETHKYLTFINTYFQCL